MKERGAGDSRNRKKKEIYNGNKSGMSQTESLFMKAVMVEWDVEEKKLFFQRLFCCEPTRRAITSLQQHIPPTFGSV